LQVDASAITAVCIVRNPDKVRHLAWAEATAPAVLPS